MDLRIWCSEASSLGPPSPGASGPAWVCLVLVRAGMCVVGVLVGQAGDGSWGSAHLPPRQASSQLQIFSKMPPAITSDLTDGIWKRRRGEV